MRTRQKTENVGFMTTREEYVLLKDYVRQRRISMTQYLREVAVQPLIEPPAQGEGTPHDPEAA